jgi:hypothetical protein
MLLDSKWGTKPDVPVKTANHRPRRKPRSELFSSGVVLLLALLLIVVWAFSVGH